MKLIMAIVFLAMATGCLELYAPYDPNKSYSDIYFPKSEYYYNYTTNETIQKLPDGNSYNWTKGRYEFVQEW